MASNDDIDKGTVKNLMDKILADQYDDLLGKILAAPPNTVKHNINFTTVKNRNPSMPNPLWFMWEGYNDRVETKGMTDKKEQVLGLVEDLVANFLFYDRQEDEEMPIGSIESTISYGNVTVDEIVEQFKLSLLEGLDEGK